MPAMARRLSSPVFIGRSSELQTRLSEHYGLFYLLRAMASSERSGILSLTRGNRRAERMTIRMPGGSSPVRGACPNVSNQPGGLCWNTATPSRCFKSPV